MSKPLGYPKSWPNCSEEDLKEMPQREVLVGQNQKFEFYDNFVKTSKYEPYNFIPKFLMESFNISTKVANSYFLMIAALQCVPAISNTGGIPTTLVPLTIVLVADAIFAILEDRARHRADKEANSSTASRFNPTSQLFEDVKWADLEVGNFIHLKTRDKIPADIVVLAVSEPQEVPLGHCYVETKSLDGETNLKLRVAMPNTMGLVKTPRDCMKLKGDIKMEHPNKLIDQFIGTFDLNRASNTGGANGEAHEVISENNVLLRGCVLRNTEWILGVIVNTGRDTKIMMSATETLAKTSFLEGAATREIVKIMLLLVFLAFVGATGMTIWNSTNNAADINYLDWNDAESNAAVLWFIQFVYILLLHGTFIPVSLYISMTFARFGQSFFMEHDLEMYYAATDTPMKCRTRTLNEELGQISHLFSDKTGTLTRNVMDFRKASIKGKVYGRGITEIGKASWGLQGKPVPQNRLDDEKRAAANAVDHVSFYCPEYEKLMSNTGNAQEREEVRNFFKILSLCHDVIPERIDGKIKLSASNPDDEALVAAAAYFGLSFTDLQDEKAIISVSGGGKRVKDMVNIPETKEIYNILQVIAFTSKRKKMAVIVEHKGEITLLMKGAETAIQPCLAKTKANEELLKHTMAHMEEFSSEGLRCLLIGQSTLTRAVYDDWKVRYKKASVNVAEIEKKKANKPNIIDDLEAEIENGLELIGCSAIEDKLQEGVPECIAELKKAGMNIWVLTGDKQETAINISVACNLVLPEEHMKHVIVNASRCTDKKSMKQVFEHEIKAAEHDKSKAGTNPPMPRALIIDGASILIAMDPEVRESLLNFTHHCQIVVGCRVSPDQKREMVALVKDGVPGVRTLSIGDGANDVAMIQEAHIGVGIKGEEGVQAVNASDYAIAQFAFLKPLLLKHGRYNYIRMSNLIIYNFYKNIFMSMGQFWFNFVNGFSGQKYYTEIGIQAFNFPITFLPILLYAIYDMDVKPEAAYLWPQLYGAGIRNESFTNWLFWSQMSHGIIESCLCSLLPLVAMMRSSHDGYLGSFWESGAACLTAVVIVVNMKMIYIQNRFRWETVAAIMVSIGLWFAFASLVDSIQISGADNEVFLGAFIEHGLETGSFWFVVIFLVSAILAKDAIIWAYMRCFHPSKTDIIQEIEAFQMSYEDYFAFNGRQGGGFTANQGQQLSARTIEMPERRGIN